MRLKKKDKVWFIVKRTLEVQQSALDLCAVSISETPAFQKVAINNQQSVINVFQDMLGEKITTKVAH